MTTWNKAVIFDLDGTLVDSVADLTGAVNVVLAGLSRSPVTVAQVRGMVGAGAQRLLDRAVASTGDAVSMDLFTPFREAYETRLVQETRAYPGIVGALAGLRRDGMTLAVCTNKPVGMAHGVVTGLGLSVFFERLLGGDSLPVKKPRPEPLWFLCDRLGLTPDDVAFVGDSATDVNAGKAAGIHTIGVTWGYGDVSGADVVVDDVAGLVAALGGT